MNGAGKQIRETQISAGTLTMTNLMRMMRMMRIASMACKTYESLQLNQAYRSQTNRNGNKRKQVLCLRPLMKSQHIAVNAETRSTRRLLSTITSAKDGS